MKEEDYFLVLLVGTDGGYKAHHSFFEAKVRVYLHILSDYITPDEITNILDLVPTYTRKKGQKSYPTGTAQNPNLPNGWSYEPQADLPASFEEKLEYVLERIADLGPKLAKIQDRSYSAINVAYYGYTEFMGGLHLDGQMLSKLAELGVELDMDLYASGPDWPKIDDSFFIKQP